MDEADVARAFGQALRQLRQEKHLSQQALAARSGLHVNTVGAFERGAKNATVPTLLALAQALGVGPDTLLKRLPQQKAKPTTGDAVPAKRLMIQVEEVIRRGPNATRFVSRVVAAFLALPADMQRSRPPSDRE